VVEVGFPAQASFGFVPVLFPKTTVQLESNEVFESLSSPHIS
jgi:hypothetical protein